MHHSQLLTARELEVFSVLELAAFTSATDVAREIGRPVSSTQLTLRNLREREGIRLRPFVDLGVLGLLDIGLYISASGGSADDQSVLRTFLTQYSGISVLISLAGEFEYYCALPCDGLHAFSRLVSALARRLPTLPLRYVCTPRLAYVHYARKYLNKKGIQAKSFAARVTSVRVQIDDLDRRILKFLSSGKYFSLRDAARALGEPSSTVDRRVSELRHKQVIRGFLLDLDPSLLNMHGYCLLVQAASDDQTAKQLEEFANACPQVTYFVSTLGPWNYELGVEVGESVQMFQVAQQLRSKLGTKLNEIKPLQEIEVLKLGLYGY